jgi:hypothetical protein
MFHPYNHFRDRDPWDGLFYRINDGLDKAIYTVNQIESLYRKLESLSPELDKLRSWLSAAPQMKMNTRSTVSRPAAHAGRRRQRKRRSGEKIV